MFAIRTHSLDVHAGVSVAPNAAGISTVIT